MAAPERHKTTRSASGPQHRPSSVPVSFSQPVVAKQGSLFLLSTDDGDVRADSDQGLYFHDMRYISAETLRTQRCAARVVAR